MNTYFLFGHDITRIYEDEGIEGVLKQIANGCDFATYNFDPDSFDLSDRRDLLDAYEGWNGWIEITEEEYIELQKPILEN